MKKKSIYLKKALTLLVVLLSTTMFSQDLIHLNTDKTLKGSVTHIKEDVLKYKKRKDLKGPTYVVNMDYVDMITYENGEKQYFERGTIDKSQDLDISTDFFLGDRRISKTRFNKILATDKEAYKDYKNGKTLKYAGLSVAIPAYTFLAWSIGNGNASSGELIAGGACLTAGFAALVFGNTKMKKSVKKFNSNKHKSPDTPENKTNESISYEVQATPNGLGLAFKF